MEDFTSSIMRKILPSDGRNSVLTLTVMQRRRHNPNDLGSPRPKREVGSTVLLHICSDGGGKLPSLTHLPNIVAEAISPMFWSLCICWEKDALLSDYVSSLKIFSLVNLLCEREGTEVPRSSLQSNGGGLSTPSLGHQLDGRGKNSISRSSSQMEETKSLLSV